MRGEDANWRSRGGLHFCKKREQAAGRGDSPWMRSWPQPGLGVATEGWTEAGGFCHTFNYSSADEHFNYFRYDVPVDDTSITLFAPMYLCPGSSFIPGYNPQNGIKNFKVL